MIEASQQARQEQDRQAGYYDVRYRPADFKEGDIVCRRNHILSFATDKHTAKSAPTWIGAYEFVAVRSYRLQNEAGEIKDLVVS